jgi:apolipoprotein N-acyltransferase
MKLCQECRKTPWPFAFALFISSFTAFLTWLMLSFSGFNDTEQLIGSSMVFVAAAATLFHYVLSCMRRHCRHGGHHHHHATHG